MKGDFWIIIFPHIAIVFNYLVLYVIIKSIQHLRQEVVIRKTNTRIVIITILFSLLAPISGFLRYDAYLDEFPFSDAHILTLIFLVVVAMICFWSSKLFKNYLSPILNVLVLIGILQGIILNILLTIHFGFDIILGAIFPFFGYELVAPLVNVFLLLGELYQNHLSFIEKYQEKESVSNNLIIRFLQGALYRKSFVLFILFFPFYAIQQIILILFGQAPDAIVRVFVETCGFTFSDDSYCPPPPSHYLCTIASHGDPSLVQPVRKGYRRGQKIIVNRQLLVANAFEHYLEEKSPKTHQRLRSFYDSLAIPVDKWSENRLLANLFYILMKPLEWYFLAFLYFFDKEPENRIALQYMMPEEKLSELQEKYIR